jgi:hypothetical protein
MDMASKSKVRQTAQVALKGISIGISFHLF